MWEIKGKDNVVKTTVNALEYNGEWMGESYVSVTIESPSPIAFAIGDYLMYRGERFEINYDPGKIKSAPQFTKGDAFKYENVKFNSLADELTRCDFLDVVLGDNQLHFTGLPKFSFYGGVQDLANRIQANLNRAYPNQWAVVVSPEYSSTKELNVSVDTQKVWDALSILVNDFETYFTIKGRTITIGAAGVPAGHLFKYGKGNGLYEIEQNAEADQAIVTRLRAYGSTRNLPHRYYNSLTGADGQKLIPDNMAVQYLMLPSFPYTTQDPYIDSANKAALGIREGTVFFDGSQEGLEEIYPSIEDMTAEQLKAAGVPCNSTGALDVLVSAEQMTDDGVGDINEGETETTATPPTFKVTLKDLGFDINDYRTTEAATLSFKTGMLGGRDFEIVGCKKIESGGKVTGYELELNRVYDDGIKLWFPYSAYNAKAGDKFVLLYIEMPEAYIKAAAQRLKEAATEWLSKNDYSRSIYAPKVDEIFMARQHDLAMASGGKIKSLHDTLKEGMLLLFEDEDLNIDASIFIDRLTIKEDSPIPTYEVVLKEEKTVGTLQKMQNKIDSLAAGIGQGGGGYNASQIRSMIDAYGGTRFLSKIKSDRTPYALSVGGKLAAEGGVQFGPVFAEGITGFGGKVDENGRAWLESLVLRGFLEVPELRYNRTEVSVGNDWNAPGGGTLEAVEPDRDADGSPLHTGKATLRLEAGELGAVAAGDICMGIWHDSFSPESNSAEDSDDSKGNFRFSGFRTVCFRITEILDAGDNSRFRYALRDESPSYPSAFHPSAQMTFVSYGSFTRPDRRTSRYSTRTYTRYLRGVDTWEFGADNVAAQFGDLTNLSVFGFDMEGYSVYLDNVYMKGTVQSVGLARHWIEASAQQVVRHPDGTASPATLTAKGWRKDSTGRVEEHGSVSYLTASGASGTVPPAGLATRGLDFPVELRLTGGGDAGVSLTVAEVRDGDKGDKGDAGAPGAPGAPGADGAVIRTTEWEAGKKYWDGREVDPQTGVRPLDIVVVASADGLSRSVWLCTLSHTSSEGLKPGDGSLESTMSWSQFSSLTPISTPLLLADNAKITFLNTQEILIVVEGAVAGRFGGGQTPLWTGGATAATAKFALSNTGKVRFGNDGGQRVELDPSTNGMSIYDGEGRKTEFRGERVADIAGIFKAASLAVSGIVASGGTSSDEQQTKSQRVATVKAATAGNLKVSCTLELNSGHEYAEAEAEVYVTDSVGNTVWADSLSSERDTGPKSKAVNADIYLPAAGTYLVQASLRARKYDYYAPGSDLSQGPTQTYGSYAGWSGLKVGGAGTVYKAQYLSNGWAIGNGSDSYASVWEDAAGKMRFEALCGGKGMKVGPDGVRVNHGNGWGSVPRTLLSGWLNWTGSSYQWAWRSTGEGILSGNPQKQAVGKVFIPLTAGMPDPSRLSVQVTGRFTPLETAVGDITASGPTPGITVLLSSGGKATDSGFLITISEI